MLNKILTTPVDQLVELIKKNENCTINFLKNSLKVPYEIIEKWIVILEEYKVIEVNYKGFEGFVRYVEKKNEDDISKKEEKIDLYNLKETFLKKSHMKNIGKVEMQKLWPRFVLSYETEIKKIFFEEAKKRKYNDKQTIIAWKKYREEITIL